MLREIAEGEGDLTKQLSIRSGDEVGTLSKHFNSFVESLKSIIISIKDISQKNVEVKQELSAGTVETQSALSQISANINAITEQMGKLDSSISLSETSIETITNNIESLNSQIEEQSSAVEESTASVNEMVASLNNVAEITMRKKASTAKLVEAARLGGEKLKAANSSLDSLRKSINSIMETTELISNVAEQTNLLAMNAAIEAAHAGEAGKGFAVVAHEIKKMASNTSASSTTIANTLRGLIQAIEATLMHSEATNKVFVDIDKEVAGVAVALDEIASSTQELSSGGKQILEAMTLLNNVSATVKTSSEEMKAGSEEVENMIKSVKRISSEVLQGLTEIQAGGHDINQAMHAISELALKLGSNADMLNAEVNKFRT